VWVVETAPGAVYVLAWHFFGWGGIFLLQLFTANVVERAPRKKFFPVTLSSFLERLPVLLLPFADYFLAVHQPLLTMVLFFFFYTWQTVGAGTILVGWLPGAEIKLHSNV